MSQKDAPVLHTEHLTIRPLTDGELAALRDQQTDEGLRAAYGEMLDGCEKDSKNRLWYTAWAMLLKSDENVMVGDIGFKGPPVTHAVEIGYGVEEAYRNQGYASEAVAALRKWAFSQTRSLQIIFAETEKDNKASLRVLKKTEFISLRVNGAEGPRFFFKRPNGVNVPILMLAGAVLGAIFLNEMFETISIAIGMGVAAAVCLATFLARLEDAIQLKHIKEWEAANGISIPNLEEEAKRKRAQEIFEKREFFKVEAKTKVGKFFRWLTDT